MRPSKSRERKKRRVTSTKLESYSPEGTEEAEDVKNSLLTESTDLATFSDTLYQNLKVCESRKFEGAETAQQVLEQQRKRIEQLENDLRETKVEMERLRLYNRQLALGLTSLNRQGTECPNCSILSSSFSSHRPEMSGYRTEKSIHHDLEATETFGHAPSNDVFTPTSSVPNQSQEESLEAVSKVERKAQSRYWTADEHKRFLEGLARFGHKDMKAIARFVGTRNATQRQSHQNDQRPSVYSDFSSIGQRRNMGPIFGNTDEFLTNMRNRNCDDHSFSVDSFESCGLESRMASSACLNVNAFRDENETNADGLFHSATLCMTGFDQDSSFREFSTTSEGLSERRSVSNNDLSSTSFYDVEGTDTVSDRNGTCIYEWPSNNDENGVEGNNRSSNVSFVDKRPNLDTDSGSFPLEDSEYSWNALEELHEKDFSEFEDFRKFPEKSIGHISLSINSMIFDSSYESAHATVRAEEN
ncbi:Myb-like protein I [Galdieria sulphuraria]|nr:Myb-like protein I [Galdieria sulphuraria]